MEAMDTQTPTYFDDELTAALAEHLASLDRDDSYRVERVLKRSSVETTELVYFEGTGGGSLGPFVRKRIDASAQIGGAYERLFAAQRAGRRFEHLPRIVDCRRVGDELNVVMEYIEGETLGVLVDRLGATPIMRVNCILPYAMPWASSTPVLQWRGDVGAGDPSRPQTVEYHRDGCELYAR